MVTFPDIHFAASDGKTMAEALEEARDCLEEAIAVSITDNLCFIRKNYSSQMIP
jgi:predicted RNase H-like HicB family nuclease